MAGIDRFLGGVLTFIKYVHKGQVLYIPSKSVVAHSDILPYRKMNKQRSGKRSTDAVAGNIRLLFHQPHRPVKMKVVCHDSYALISVTYKREGVFYIFRRVRAFVLHDESVLGDTVFRENSPHTLSLADVLSLTLASREDCYGVGVVFEIFKGADNAVVQRNRRLLAIDRRPEHNDTLNAIGGGREHIPYDKALTYRKRGQESYDEYHRDNARRMLERKSSDKHNIGAERREYERSGRPYPQKRCVYTSSDNYHEKIRKKQKSRTEQYQRTPKEEPLIARCLGVFFFCAFRFFCFFHLYKKISFFVRYSLLLPPPSFSETLKNCSLSSMTLRAESIAFTLILSGSPSCPHSSARR